MFLSSPEPPTVPNITSPYAPTGLALFMPSFRGLLFNLSTFAALVVLPLACIICGVFLALIFGHLSAIVTVTLGFVGISICTVVYPIVFVTRLKSAQGQGLELRATIKQSLHVMPRMLGLAFILTTLFGIGLVLLVVPGMFAISKYYLAPYHLIDKDLDIRAALKASAEASRGYGMIILGIIIVDILFLLLLFIPIFGWLLALVTLTLYSYAPAVCYENIQLARQLPPEYQQTLTP